MADQYSPGQRGVFAIAKTLAEDSSVLGYNTERARRVMQRLAQNPELMRAARQGFRELVDAGVQKIQEAVADGRMDQFRNRDFGRVGQPLQLKLDYNGERQLAEWAVTHHLLGGVRDYHGLLEEPHVLYLRLQVEGERGPGLRLMADWAVLAGLTEGMEEKEELADDFSDLLGVLGKGPDLPTPTPMPAQVATTATTTASKSRSRRAKIGEACADNSNCNTQCCLEGTCRSSKDPGCKSQKQYGPSRSTARRGGMTVEEFRALVEQDDGQWLGDCDIHTAPCPWYCDRSRTGKHKCVRKAAAYLDPSSVFRRDKVSRR